MFWRTLVAVADIAAIAARFDALKTLLDERSRRLLAAAESQAVGKGGISIVSKATGISRPVIRQGITDLKEPTALTPGRVRKQGGGRKKATDKDASLKTDLVSLLESTTRGDPRAALRWTCKSVRQLTEELKRRKHQVSHQVVADLLHELGYSLQANRKTKKSFDGLAGLMEPMKKKNLEVQTANLKVEDGLELACQEMRQERFGLDPNKPEDDKKIDQAHKIFEGFLRKHRRSLKTT